MDRLAAVLTRTHQTNLMTDREIILLTICHAILIITLSMRHNTKAAILTYLNQHATAIENKQIADLQALHRKYITQLKLAQNTQTQQLRQDLSDAQSDVERRDLENEWMTATYQDNMRLVQEQEDRIVYLEAKLQEYGQVTPATHQPYSAPASQIQFENPPRRGMRVGGTGLGGLGSVALEQVLEAQEEIL